MANQVVFERAPGGATSPINAEASTSVDNAARAAGLDPEQWDFFDVNDNELDGDDEVGTNRLGKVTILATQKKTKAA